MKYDLPHYRFLLDCMFQFQVIKQFFISYKDSPVQIADFNQHFYLLFYLLKFIFPKTILLRVKM